MRPPEVFVRSLEPDEANRLKSISRRAKYQSKRERAMIVLASHTRSDVHRDIGSSGSRAIA